MIASSRRLRAVLSREMRTLGRGKSLFLLRALAGLAAVLVLWLFLEDTLRRLGPPLTMVKMSAVARQAADVFSGLVILQTFLVLVLAALLGVLTVTSEWRDKTLGLLVLSRLRPAEILAGKSFSNLAFLLAILLAPLPLLVLLGWSGGIDSRYLGWLALLVTSLGFFALSLGMSVALRIRSPVVACLVTLAILTGWFCLPFFVPGTTGPQVLANHPGFGWAWPFQAAAEIASQGGQPAPSSSLLGPLLVPVAAGLLLLLEALRALPRLAGQGPRPGVRALYGRLDGFFHRINPGGIVLFRGGGSPRGNPVAWLARRSQGFGLPAHSARWASAVAVAGLLALILFLEGSLGWETFVFFVITGVVLGGLATGSLSVAGERNRKSLSVLLTCPLSARSILAGKCRAAFRLFLFFGAPLLALAALIHALMVWGDPLVGLLISSLGAVLGLAAFSLALAASLTFTNPLRAGLVAAGELTLAHLLPLGGMLAGLTLFHRSSAASFGLAGLLLVLLFSLIVGGGLILAYDGFRRANPHRQVLGGGLVLLPVLGLVLMVPDEAGGLPLEALYDSLRLTLLARDLVGYRDQHTAALLLLYMPVVVVSSLCVLLAALAGFNASLERAS